MLCNVLLTKNGSIFSFNETQRRAFPPSVFFCPLRSQMLSFLILSYLNISFDLRCQFSFAEGETLTVHTSGALKWHINFLYKKRKEKVKHYNQCKKRIAQTYELKYKLKRETKYWIKHKILFSVLWKCILEPKLVKLSIYWFFYFKSLSYDHKPGIVTSRRSQIRLGLGVLSAQRADAPLHRGGSGSDLPTLKRRTLGLILETPWDWLWFL